MSDSISAGRCFGGHTGPRCFQLGVPGRYPQAMPEALHAIRMVDVAEKPVTIRTARATARLRASPGTIERIRAGTLEKGDAIATARLAGIMAAKRTADIVPLCHPLPLDAVELTILLPHAEADSVLIESTVRATARTGVEMEALLAVSAAALTIYDMCKSIDRNLRIEAVQLEEKTGGIRGNYTRSADGNSV